VRQFIRLSCAGLVLALAAGQVSAQGFGTLESAGEAAAKAKAAEWLKEVGKTDEATMKKFEAIWSQKDRTVIDRLGETFTIANPTAQRLLGEARDPNWIPPEKAPSLLTGGDSPFFRANLALAYARILTIRRAYDESLAVLKIVKPEQVVDPSGYLFYRAVCEHAVLLKDESTKSINRLLTDALDAPDRYKSVAHLMIKEMDGWQDADLGTVARLMRQVEERLDLAKAGKKTQAIQKDIINRLDELIEALEAGAQGAAPGEGDGDGDGDGDGQGEGGGKKAGGNKGGDKGAQDSNIPTAPGMSGAVDMAAIKKLQENWGSLPPRERERQLNLLTQGMSPSHRQAIENYFRNIALDRRPPR